MGRGRQKAKQTKVARRRKYYSPETDYRALERDLASQDRSSDSDDYEIPSAVDEDDWAPAPAEPSASPARSVQLHGAAVGALGSGHDATAGFGAAGHPSQLPGRYAGIPGAVQCCLCSIRGDHGHHPDTEVEGLLQVRPLHRSQGADQLEDRWHLP